jgi:hypothetical protein
MKPTPAIGSCQSTGLPNAGTSNRYLDNSQGQACLQALSSTTMVFGNPAPHNVSHLSSNQRPWAGFQQCRIHNFIGERYLSQNPKEYTLHPRLRFMISIVFDKS